MNQILSTENNYKKQDRKKGEILDTRKILIIFSIILIVFALVIVVAKIVGTIKENKKDKDNPIDVLNKPTIEIEKKDNLCNIKVSYDVGLEKVIYWWNDDENIKENNLNGTTQLTTGVELLEGDYNVLYVKAIGIDGSINEIKREFSIEQYDPTKPKIVFNYTENEVTTIEIMASSEKGIKEMEYNWEGEEPQIVTPTTEGGAQVAITVPAKRGTNRLYVRATDMEGNTQTKEQLIIAVIKPTVEFNIDQTVDGNILKIHVEHDKGFKEVIITINQQEIFVYNESNTQYRSDTTNLKMDVNIPEGSIDVVVKVYTLEQPDKEYVVDGHADI